MISRHSVQSILSSSQSTAQAKKKARDLAYFLHVEPILGSFRWSRDRGDPRGHSRSQSFVYISLFSHSFLFRSQNHQLLVQPHHQLFLRRKSTMFQGFALFDRMTERNGNSPLFTSFLRQLDQWEDALGDRGLESWWLDTKGKARFKRVEGWLYRKKKEELGSGNRSHKLIHSQLVILRKVPAIKERIRILRMYFQISHALY